MRLFLSVWLALLALTSLGAVPDYKAFRGTGGITVVTNPPTGTIVIDGSGVAAAGGTNAINVAAGSGVNVVTNGTVFTVSLTMATNAYISSTYWDVDPATGDLIPATSSAFRVGRTGRMVHSVNSASGYYVNDRAGMTVNGNQLQIGNNPSWSMMTFIVDGATTMFMQSNHVSIGDVNPLSMLDVYGDIRGRELKLADGTGVFAKGIGLKAPSGLPAGYNFVFPNTIANGYFKITMLDATNAAVSFDTPAGGGGGGTNSSLAIAVGGSLISGVATQLNLVGGTNVFLTSTNASGAVSVGIHATSSGGSTQMLAFAAGSGTITNVLQVMGNVLISSNLSAVDINVSDELTLSALNPLILLRLDAGNLVSETLIGNGISFDGQTLAVAASVTNGLNTAMAGKVDELNGVATNLSAFAGDIASIPLSVRPTTGGTNMMLALLDTNGVIVSGVTSGGSLGIGTLTPARSLHVNGTGIISERTNASPQLVLRISGTLAQDWNFNVATDGSFKIRDNTGATIPDLLGIIPDSAAALTIGLSGVGINNATPAALLHVVSQPTNALPLLKLGTNATGSFIVTSNGLAQVAGGTALDPGVQWLDDADGSGTGFFRPLANAIGISHNGLERFRFNSSGAFDIGPSPLWLGAAIGNTDMTLGRDAAGTLAMKNGLAAFTNRIYRSVVGTTSFAPTNAAWLESGFDGAHGWAFLRSMADGSNATTQPLVLGINTNELLRLHTNGTVVVKAPLLYLPGAGTAGQVLTSTDTAGTVGWAAAGGGGGGATPLTQSNGWLRLQLQSCILPTNNMPALDTGTNLVWRLLFDDTTAETAYWDFVLPDDYGTNATVVCTYSTLAAAASKTNCFVFQTQVLKPLVSNNINVDSWTASGGSTNVIPTVNGWATNFSGNLSLSAVAGDFVRLKINRDAASVMDSSVGDTALHAIAIRYTKQ